MTKGQDMKRPDKRKYGFMSNPEENISAAKVKGWNECHKAHDPIIEYQEQRIKELEDKVTTLELVIAKHELTHKCKRRKN